ncbi:MAG TPA: DEAD/DEAH box helicase, partial [Acidimicrobiales bacterium]|nr:DEAD/DEAH box helicase [Acidimicrobiales bacterium]
MSVLHAAWDAEGRVLVLWGEAERKGKDAKTGIPARGTRRDASTGSPAPHPFAASVEEVKDTLAGGGDAATGHVAAGGVAGSATLLLPARRGVPAPSPELLGLLPDGGRPPHSGRWTLREFTVPALRLAPGDALDVLLALACAPAPVHAGASVGALARVGELALEAAAAGRVAPALDILDGTHVARWAPLRTGRDAERLALLRNGMPRVASSIVQDTGHDGVVDHAFDTFVDVVCREALARPAGERGRAPLRARSGSASDAWLAALAGPGGTVEGDPASLAALDRLVAEWRSPLVAPAGSWRLCFRLHEPDDAPEGDGTGRGTPWRVELLLQAVDEPTLLVDAAEVWRAGEALRRAARTVELPQEVLLAELGRALHAFPELGEALAERAPTMLSLGLDGAHRFLSEVAPALELAGFGVLLPSWWRQPSVRLGLRVRAASTPSARAGPGRLTFQGLAAFDWEVALGDTRLAPAELRRLAKLKAPLVRVRGQWTELHPGEVQRLVDFLSTGRARRAMSLVDVLRAAAGAALPGVGVPVVAVDAAGPLGALLRGELADSLEVGSTPEGFHGELRAYQRRGVGWIRFLERIGLGACLADDMGLGKTATVLGVLQSDRVDGADRGPTLVVCPTSVVGNWRREVERFTPELKVVVHHGATRAKGDSLRHEVADADVVVTSYPLVERDRAALASVPWSRLVLDEAQQVKNPSAKQTQAVRAIPAPRRLALTGTPVENHLGELWSIMEVLNPGLLGSQRSFREQFAVPIERYGAEEPLERLRTLTRPFVLRRLKSDRKIVPDLPDKIETKERCALTREQVSLYQAVVDEMLARIAGAEGIERRGLVLATMLRLKQVCNHPAQYAADDSALAGRSGKLERTVEILEQVRGAGERALVFTQFAEMGTLLQRHLTERLGCRVGFLHGGVPRVRRDRLVAELQSPVGTMPVLVVSLKAGGTGLNLTAASHVLHYDRWWNPAVEDQATDRAYRIGQRRDVQVRKLLCAGTVEDRIDEMIESKRALAAQVVGTGEGWLTELSTEDLA